MSNFDLATKVYRDTRAGAHKAGITLPYAWLMNSRAFAGIVASHPDPQQREKMIQGRYLLIDRKQVPVVLDEATTDVYFLPVKQINSRQLRQYRTPSTPAQLSEAWSRWSA